MQLGDITERNETETKSPNITDDCGDNNVVSIEQSQSVVEDLRHDDEKVSLDWNANKSSEISVSTDSTGDADVPATESAGEQQESRVCFNSDGELATEEVVETRDGMSDPAAVAVVTVLASCSSPPMTDIPNDDSPPPLPTSQPPSSSEFPPRDHDTSQDLSILVADDPHSTAAIIPPPSPYANPETDTPLTKMDLGLASEQFDSEHIGEEGSTDEYCTLSDEDQLLVQRMLMTTKERQISAPEETIVGGYANNESEEKDSDLSECERKLIENTLASLGQRQPDVHNDIGTENSATLSELPVRDFDDGYSDNKMCEDGIENENMSSIKIEIQESSQDQDISEEDKGVSDEVEKVNVNSTEITTQGSSEAQEQEPDKIITEHVEDISVGTMPASEVITSELTDGADQLPASTAAFSSDDLNTTESAVGNPLNRHNENYEPIAIVPAEIEAITGTESQELDSPNHLISTTNTSPDDVDATEDFGDRAVNARRENDSEPTEFAQSLISVDEASGRVEPSTTTDTSSTSTNNVFCNSSDNFPAEAQICDVETDALSKSRRTLLSDEAVSGILRDYYTADVDVEEQKPEKPKPVKPLIAQALLPKTTRRPLGTLNSGSSTAVAASTLSQTTNGFSNGKLGYSQVELPQVITLSERSEVSVAEDDQRSKPAIGQDRDDVIHDNVTASGNSDSETMHESNIGADKSTNSDIERADGREVPTVAESRAFFKSRETALKNGSGKSPFVQPNPVTESFSTVAINETQAVLAASPQASQRSLVESGRPHGSLSSSWQESSWRTAQSVITDSSQVEVETTSKTVPLESVAKVGQGELDVTGSRQESNDMSTITSSQPVTSTSSTASHESGNGGGVASTGRLPMSTRWAPKPFSLTKPTTKSTPRFMTFEPMFPTREIPETTESDVPPDNPTEVTKVESSPSFNGFRTVAETASTEPKPKPKRNSLPSIVMAAGTPSGSVERSSDKDKDKWTTKSNDVETATVGITDIADTNVMLQASEPQSPCHTHPYVSAAAMATELKKMGKMPTRTPSISGQNHSQAHNSSSVGVGRSCSMSQVDVQSKSVSSNGCTSTSRGPQTLAKSWTQCSYRTAVAPARTEALLSTVDEQDSKRCSSEVEEDVEHISVASSKAFFQAAEQAEKQALNEHGAKKSSRKSTPTSNVKIVAPAKHDEERSSATAEIDLSLSSDSSCSTHSASFATNSGKQPLYCF